MKLINAVKKMFCKSSLFELPYFLCFAISYMLSFFAAIDMYYSNKDEFWFDFYNMLPMLLLLFGALFAALIMVFFIARIFGLEWYRLAVLMAFSLFICLYIQGNYLTRDLPVIGLAEVDWSIYKTQNIITTVVMFIVVISLLAVLLKTRSKFWGITRIICIGMSLMLILTNCIEIVSGELLVRSKDNSITNAELWNFSKSNNCLIMLLDHFDSKEFKELLANDLELQQELVGFTFFEDAQGMYPYTEYSIPYVLTGEKYVYQSDYTDYYNNAIEKSPILNYVMEKGYQIGIYETNLRQGVDSKFDFCNVKPLSYRASSNVLFAEYQLKYILYRYLPYFMKSKVAIDGSEFNRIKMLSGATTFDWGMNGFHENIKHMNAINEKCCFKFIHLQGVHFPYNLEEDLSLIDNGDREKSKKANSLLIKEYLKMLKDIGIYDKTNIVIMADHGLNENNIAANPLFLAKGQDESHPLHISDKRFSYEDFQQGCVDMMKGNSADSSFLAHDGNRIFFFYYGWPTKWKYMIEMTNSGKASDNVNFIETGKVYGVNDINGPTTVAELDDYFWWWGD